MFKQIFETVALPYRLPADMFGIPSGTGLGALFNGDLVDPPRIYAEEIDFPLSLFSKLDPTPTSETTTTLIGVTRVIYWPGYQWLAWRFDNITGAFIDRTEMSGDILTSILHMDSITQGFDRSMWASYSLGEIREYDGDSYALMQTVTASHFGRSGTAIPLVDKARDLVVMPAEGGAAQVIVYALSTGDVVRTIGTSGAPIAVCAEDDKRIYSLGSNYVLNLIDYTTGEVISTYRCPAPPSASYVMLTWDRFLRRLLVFAQVANASDGSSQNVIRGFYPVPLATHLTTPIPLRPPRRGRQIPVLLRAVGDVGEPIAGVTPQVGATGAGIVNTTTQGTDTNGESIARLLCVSAGSVTVNVAASVDD